MGVPWLCGVLYIVDIGFFHELVHLYFVSFVTSPSLRGLLLLYVGEWPCSEDLCEWPPLLRH